jgi:hypothetical protein
MDILHHTSQASSALLTSLVGVSSGLPRLAASLFRLTGSLPLAVVHFLWLHPSSGTLFRLTFSSRHRCLSFAPC